MTHVNSFRELEVYKKARKISQEIFELSKSFPKTEMYSLTDQIMRSSRSVGAQIAEAWAKRRYEKHFISKLTDADGEQQETQHWIETSFDCKYISSEKREYFISEYSEVGKMIYSMINKSSLFCNNNDTSE
jgi:four helix bundle protein